MSKFLCRAILLGGFRVEVSTPTIDLCILRIPNLGNLRWFSNSSKVQSFTVSYLVDTFGFSRKAALEASKHVAFETSGKPEKAISLFKKYGFNESQISCIMRRRPSLLMSDLEKTIVPKLEFFDAKGFSMPTFAKRLCRFPTVLHSSLDKQIVPTYEFLRGFFGSDEKVVKAVNRWPNLLSQKVENYFKPNIAVLREHGVPDSSIASMIQESPMVPLRSSTRFLDLVQKVAGLGFSPLRLNFVVAVSALGSISQATWESKVCTFKELGWSDQDVSKIFRTKPQTMKLSTDKITASINFFLKEVGLDRSQITKRPQLLGMSLEKRLVPRNFVFGALVAKGLVKKELSPSRMFEMTEQEFLKKFVMPFVEQGIAPDLLKLYNEKLERVSTRPKAVEARDKRTSQI